MESRKDNIILQTHDLTFYYGKDRGVLGDDISGEKGEAFYFLGPNGVGKTTLQRFFLDVIHPTSGPVSIFGLDCLEQGVQFRDRIGYLPGEFNPYPNMKGHGVLKMPASVQKKMIVDISVNYMTGSTWILHER